MTESEDVNRMDCTQFEAILHDLDRSGTRGLALRETALGHAESCEQCARLMTEAEALDFSLQTLAMHDADLAPTPRIELSLLREFRRQKAAASRRKVQWQLTALGAAAAVLLAFGISLRHAENVRPTGNGASKVSAKLNVAPELATQALENQSGDSESATAFVALPYATDPGTLEDGTVVRVLLSRPALASLGLPVSNMGAAAEIPADIVLSEDGAPQAIRLVSQEQVDYSLEAATALWGGRNEP